MQYKAAIAKKAAVKKAAQAKKKARHGHVHFDVPPASVQLFTKVSYEKGLKSVPYDQAQVSISMALCRFVGGLFRGVASRDVCACMLLGSFLHFGLA
jgi:hypothetical protein